jgi:hypothetical protein
MSSNIRMVGLRQARPVTGRTVAAVFAAALVFGVVSGCGSSHSPGVASAGSAATSSSVSSSSVSSRSPSNGALAFSQCMRSHGVPNFPDPDSSGTPPKVTPSQLGVSESQYHAAYTACAPMLPSSGGPSQTEEQQTMTALRRFAACMRSQGVSNWPDPDHDSQGDPIFYLQGEIDEHAPQIVSKIQACAHLVPPASQVGGPPGGVPMCPGDNPGPTATSACGGRHQGG